MRNKIYYKIVHLSITILWLSIGTLSAQYSIQNIQYETDSCDGSFELNVKGTTFPLDVFSVNNKK